MEASMEQKLRVCIWDDNGDSRANVRLVLEKLGAYQISEYRSGAGSVEELVALRSQLLLVDVDYSLPEPERMLPELRRQLPELRLFALSRRLDEAARRRYHAAGFEAVLLKPLAADSLLQALDANKRARAEDSAQVLSFMSPKGKSGRTTLIVNLALSLARISGEKVGIIDAETNFADVDAFLNLNPRSTIVEALRDLSYLNADSLQNYFEEVSDKVFVLCGAKTPQQAAFLAPEGLTRLLQLARGGFRYLLVDLGSGFTPLSIAAAEASERVYLTAMADGTFEVLHLKRTLEIMRSLEDWERRVSCVITRMTPDVRRAKQLEEQIGCPVLLIPNEYRLCAEAANNGRMAVDIGRSSTLTQQIDRMAFAINNGGR